MKKILYVANITQHIIRFHLPYLQWFKENGYEIHVASNGNERIDFCDEQFNIPIQRTPYSTKTLRAFFLLKNIIDKNQYDLIVTNTPIAAALTRLAAVNSRLKGTKVIYMVHGMSFYNGAPIMDWLIYYPVERFLSFFTDCFITINDEEYQRLYNWQPKRVYKINGIGIKNERFSPICDEMKNRLRKELGYTENHFIIVYSAEFIHRKNHKFIIDSTNLLAENIPGIKILFLGRGALLQQMKEFAVKKGVDRYIDFLGFRNDVPRFLAIADVGISASKNEGLPINIVEEMFMSLPIVATIEKGHIELIKHGVNGFLFDQNNKLQFVNCITELSNNPELRFKLGIQSSVLVQKFSLPISLAQLSTIFKQQLNDS